MVGVSGKDWDFLKPPVDSPAHANHYFAPGNVGKETAFKPGWKTKRPQAVIQQDTVRKQEEAFKEQRSAHTQEIRAQRLTELNQRGFNPISQQELQPDGTWRLASDPWQHQKVGVRAQDPRSAASETTRMQADTTRKNVAILEMRRERIANGGVTRHAGGTVADALKWSDS